MVTIYDIAKATGHTAPTVSKALNGLGTLSEKTRKYIVDTAKEMGYEKIITYILESENGVSLKAAGWEQESTTKGGEWNRKNRPRNTTAPTVPKKRYGKNLIEKRISFYSDSPMVFDNEYRNNSIEEVID